MTPRQARSAFDQLEGTLTDLIGAVDATLFDLIARLEASLDFRTRAIISWKREPRVLRYAPSKRSSRAWSGMPDAED